MNIRELLAAICLEESNFYILHWNCHSMKFDHMHQMAQEWYERCTEEKDAIAEMVMRVGMKPIHYGEAIEILKDSEVNFKILSSDDSFDWDEFMKESQDIISKICKSFRLVLDGDDMKKPENMGIKGSLEGMYEDWDLDMRYKNAHRMK